MTAVGQPLSRIDGRLKVTGRARYSGDVPVADALHAVIVHSRIAHGRTLSIDARAAERSPGVVAVFTHETMPRIGPAPWRWSPKHPTGQYHHPLQNDEIHYAGQPVALVVARSVVEAEFAGTLVDVVYEELPFRRFDERAIADAVEVGTPQEDGRKVPARLYWETSSSVGSADTAIANAAVRIRQDYSTSDRHHNQMEPHHTLAVWGSDDCLTLYDTTQNVSGVQGLVAIVLDMAPERVRIVAPFLGGGFGGKAYVWPHTILAAVAARSLRQPVRLELSRAQMYSMAGHQPMTLQQVSLGADVDGRLVGIRHDSVSPTPPFEDYIEYAGNASRSLWAASGGIATHHRVARVHRNTPSPMRAPHEAVGLFALESAMDELAYETGIDPLALRLLNDTQIDPLSNRPFSTRRLDTCITEGARRFGWDRRRAEPRSMRDGQYLVGQGMAGAIYTAWRWPAQARVTLRSDGSALVESGMHDIGTGTYTVMRQVAADALGLAPDMVAVQLGDTRMPASHPAAGSATMSNAGASVLLASIAARDKAIALAISGRNAPFATASASEIIAGGGRLMPGSGAPGIGYADLLARNGLSSLVGEGDYKPVDEVKGPRAVFSFAAVFVEVRVDPDLGLVRLSRVTAMYDAGRTINPKTARSQAVGGIIWGAGQALLEKSEIDPLLGRFVNRNYSGYLVPSNADIPDLDIGFVGEFDSEASPTGAKGLGEVTGAGVAPAIANAVFHATGRRIRDLPITIEKLL